MNKREKKESLELNERQLALLNVLERMGDNYVYQIDIARALPQYYSYSNEKAFHDSPARFTMTKDIREINKNYNCPKIILSNANGIKLANKNEFKNAMQQEFGMIFRKLVRARIKKEKGGLNGQMILPIFFNSEQDFINAFID